LIVLTGSLLQAVGGYHRRSSWQTITVGCWPWCWMRWCWDDWNSDAEWQLQYDYWELQSDRRPEWQEFRHRQWCGRFIV